ncbi:sigma-70 family RNA polymerase sigma factor [Kitasatospora sp. GP82]|uniref:sigma-70 family RNA polymerase sigma factor n=1 Tax=Kitasatospora sp. GP82 TaxID=3035089 RepID=UPI0024731012|nr:sigma-70 family RNA polymerase sigma factor [Kitasatospora sp. GP82]MDH6126202.1 RNA polymerase sigma-70 factor (ECF subfamily) [Kitasatospora sp. GP82]
MAAAQPTPSRAAPSWDEQIRWRLARGEETALGELYDRFGPLVHGLAGCILDDRSAAQQLTREVFAHLWEHPDAFDPAQGSLRSWLGALTRRRALDRLRLMHTDGRELRARATAARVQYVVESLPDPLRESLAVTYFDGRTYQETARRLGISEQDAKHRIRLGLELLAGELCEEETAERAGRTKWEQPGAGRTDAAGAGS